MATTIKAPSAYSGPAQYGPLALEFVDGEATTSTALNDGQRRYFERRGFIVTEDADATPTAAASTDPEAYDPGAHNVAEVIEYLDQATDAERDRVLAAEAAGQDRKGIREYVAPAEPTEDGDTE